VAAIAGPSLSAGPVFRDSRSNATAGCTGEGKRTDLVESQATSYGSESVAWLRGADSSGPERQLVGGILDDPTLFMEPV
jgi:hypothetical protein